MANEVDQPAIAGGGRTGDGVNFGDEQVTHRVEAQRRDDWS